MIQNRVTIEGIDFHFGLGFLADLSEKTGMDLGQLGEQMIKNPLFIVPKMMMHSANYAIYRDGKDSESYYNIDFISNATRLFFCFHSKVRIFQATWVIFYNLDTEQLKRDTP